MSSSKQKSASPLAKSSLHHQIEALKQDQQWLLKQIKRKRTELTNFVNQLQDISREVFSRCTPIFQEIMERDQEIHRLFAEISKDRKIRKKNRKKIQEVYKNLKAGGIISPHSPEESKGFSSYQKKEFSEEKNESALPKETSAPPPNQGEIRETFLRLASRFHPDKVTDEETQDQYTAIMQQVNEAYQAGDFAKLLEIERKQHNEDLIAVAENQENSLEKERDRLTQDNNVLRQQYEEIKQELRYLRNTSEGEIVTEYRRATKAGIDPLQETVEEAEMQLEAITEIRDFVRDFRDKKMTLQAFLAGPSSDEFIDPDEVALMLEELLRADFDET
ncbi:MAG: J domain-containing protein [Halothece sp.]